MAHTVPRGGRVRCDRGDAVRVVGTTPTTGLASCPACGGCERLRVLSGPPSRLWVFPDSRSRRRARMYLHASARLGLAGRLALVRAIEGGLSLRAAAARFGVSPATAHRWWHRWLAGDE